MPIISVAIQKGGSGKTTTAINLGAAFQLSGKKVLLIDADPQANLSQSLGMPAEPQFNLYSEIKKEITGENSDIKKAIVEIRPGFSIVPASIELADAEIELVSVYSREQVLSWVLKPVINDYDFIFIDCPPSVGMLTVNALVASDMVLIPLQAEFLPLKGVQSFIRLFNSIKKRLNPKITLLGFTLNKFDDRKKMNHHVQEQLAAEFGNKVFQTYIRTCISLAKAQEAGIDVFSFDKNSNAARDYKQLAEELLEKLKH
jgi:chromosome partitioning protein